MTSPLDTGRPSVPTLVVGGVSSGVGKTTLTVALIAAFRARGLVVAPFKCGPDYLDPTYHALAAGRSCQNLDGWMMGREAVRRTFLRATEDADIAIVEGVMGLFDGASARSEAGSTAEIAKWLGAPVLLMIDASGMARSVAALLRGFASFDRGLRVAGAIANRVGSRRHLEILQESGGGVPLLGALPKDAEHAFAERHLGLHTANSDSLPESELEYWAEVASSWVDLDALLELARSAAIPLESAVADSRAEPNSTPRIRTRIGIARDAAFHFYYADNLRRLEAAGAELIAFSPLESAALPNADGLYLGGGYPELYARELSANAALREAIVRAAERGMPIYAECGGLMYLTEAIVDLDGSYHPMVGLLPSKARMHASRRALGYVEVELQHDTFLGAAGSRFRGHQFRYSELDPEPPEETIERSYRLRGRRGRETTLEGYRRDNVLGSYVHAHWASNPSLAEGFVWSCARWARSPEGGRTASTRTASQPSEPRRIDARRGEP